MIQPSRSKVSIVHPNVRQIQYTTSLDKICILSISSKAGIDHQEDLKNAKLFSWLPTHRHIFDNPCAPCLLLKVRIIILVFFVVDSSMFHKDASLIIQFC